MSSPVASARTARRFSWDSKPVSLPPTRCQPPYRSSGFQACGAIPGAGSVFFRGERPISRRVLSCGPIRPGCRAWGRVQGQARRGFLTFLLGCFAFKWKSATAAALDHDFRPRPGSRTPSRASSAAVRNGNHFDAGAAAPGARAEDQDHGARRGRPAASASAYPILPLGTVGNYSAPGRAAPGGPAVNKTVSLFETRRPPRSRSMASTMAAGSAPARPGPVIPHARYRCRVPTMRCPRCRSVSRLAWVAGCSHMSSSSRAPHHRTR